MITWKNLFGWLTSSNARSGATELLRTTDEMRDIMERERMRSDRCRTSFCLLTITLSTENADQRAPQLPKLAHLIRDRLRATDEVGLLGPWQLGIVLPGTPTKGAWKLADDICAALSEDEPRPTCNVYEYSGSRPEDDGAAPDRQDPEFAHSPELVTASPIREEQREVQPMDALFMRPLPVWKRALDIVTAGSALLLLSPLLAIVAVAIRWTSPGPAIFAQRRHTLGGRIFTMYKFRTMSVDAEARKAALRAFDESGGPTFKMANDPRVTPLGRFLRKTSIDELPQLFNVLKGDMTLVGPRAMPCDESDGCEGWQRRRLNVTAGLTCIWQVSGRSRIGFTDRMRMDVRYLDHCSLGNDLKLIAQTVPAVVRGSGAY